MKRTAACGFVLASLFVSCPLLNSTTIIAFIGEDRILIATDAKSSISNSEGHFNHVKICKIYQSGDSYFAFQGFDQWDDINFTSSEIAKKNTMLTVEGRAEAFAREAKAPLLTALQFGYRVRNEGNNFPIYQALIGSPKYPLIALFVGMESGSSVFEEVKMVKVVDSHDRPIRIDTEIQNCPGNFCPPKGKLASFWLGETDAAKEEYSRMLARHDNPMKDLVATLRHLVETEIAAVPSTVGPPIAILEINKSGSRWVVGGECAKVTNTPKVKPEPRKAKSLR